MASVSLLFVFCFKAVPISNVTDMESEPCDLGLGLMIFNVFTLLLRLYQGRKCL